MDITTATSGFPSPADDYIETNLDLNELLVKKPAATFFVRAQGDDATLASGIHSGDILIVDRSMEPASGKVVVCILDGGLTVKRLVQDNEQWKLLSENHPDIIVHDDVEMMIWGVVTGMVRQL